MNIYPKIFAPSFKQLIMFELTSWIGRHFHKKRRRFKIPIDHKSFLVDITTDQNFSVGWTHVNFYRSPFRLRSRFRKIRRSEIETDLRFPLSCPDNCVDGIYSSHTLEHLYPDHAWHLLSEMYRVLKAGSWLRICVPDLEIIVNFYNKKPTNIQTENR